MFLKKRATAISPKHFIGPTIQYCSSIKNNLPTISIRNSKESKKSAIKVVYPEVFLSKTLITHLLKD
jgi:hypothetical protein